MCINLLEIFKKVLWGKFAYARRRKSYTARPGLRIACFSPAPMSILLRPSLLLAWLLLLGACSAPQQTQRVSAPPGNAEAAPSHAGNLTNFAGNWEKNYQLSDDFNTKFQLYVADVLRRVTQGNPELAARGGFGLDGEAINGLARFAEELTRMPILDIAQDEQGITVQRQEDFALRCRYRDRLYVRDSSPFGNELCGWNNDKLVFNMDLPGGLSIVHQFSLSPDAAQLNVTTTVSSDLVAVPVIISNYYTRYINNDRFYDCELTLTRNRVCSQRGGAQ
jgi:hypothetical protein